MNQNLNSLKNIHFIDLLYEKQKNSKSNENKENDFTLALYQPQKNSFDNSRKKKNLDFFLTRHYNLDDLLTLSQQISYSLLSLNIDIQDKVGIFSSNIPEWTIADIAILQIRGVTVPIFSTSNISQAEYIINHSDMKILFIEGENEFNIVKQLVLENKCPHLEHVVFLHNSLSIKTLTSLPILNKQLNKNDFFLSFESFIKIPTSLSEEKRNTILNTFSQRLAYKNLDDLFTIIYTSGTTGLSKGVMLTHANLSSQLDHHQNSQFIQKLSDKDISLCFLPLSHIFERAWTFFVLSQNGKNIYLQDPKLIQSALKDVKPTVMCAVPRFFEKIYAYIFDKAKHGNLLKKSFFHTFYYLKSFVFNYSKKHQMQSLPFYLSLLNKVSDYFVFNKIKKTLFSNIKMMPCGGSKLDSKIAEFFTLCNVNIKCGYGMTETTATVSCWSEDTHFDFSSIGKVIEGCEVKIDPKNNEILVKSDSVMKGYYKNPEETEKTFTKDGFLKTGDVGHFDEHGNLYLTDRIKDLMKTSTSKYIAPQLIESKILKDKLFEQIAVIAESQKYVSALIVPCLDTLEEYAKRLKINYSDKLELLKNAKLLKVIEDKINELQKDLQDYEKIKKFTLLPKSFTVEQDEITPTLKLKRKNILEKYKEVIDKMYKN